MIFLILNNFLTNFSFFAIQKKYRNINNEYNNKFKFNHKINVEN